LKPQTSTCFAAEGQQVGNLPAISSCGPTPTGLPKGGRTMDKDKGDTLTENISVNKGEMTFFMMMSQRAREIILKPINCAKKQPTTTE